MLRNTLLIALLATQLQAIAQNKPVINPVVPAPTRTPETPPAAYVNPQLNTFITYTPAIPMTSTDVTVLDGKLNAEMTKETVFFDRFGRPVQSIKRGSTPGGFDIVSPKVFNGSGMEALMYLPYPSTVYNSDFRTNAFTEQNNYYTAESQPGKRFAGEKFFYGETIFENSPEHRPLMQMSVGNSWVGSSRGVSTAHLLNTASEMVVRWMYPNATATMPTAMGYYPDGKLSKTVSTDANGKRSIVYRNDEDNIILEKEELTVGGTTYEGWLCTYFIYDQGGELRYVLPPLAVEAIKSDWNLQSRPEVMQNLVFAFNIDDRGRKISEKVPEMDLIEYVYDSRDRLAFTRDGLQRQKGLWTAKLYDALNREIVTGHYISIKTRAELQAELDAAASGTTLNYTYTSSTVANLTLTQHRQGVREYIASTSITLDPGFDSGSGEVDFITDPYLQIVSTNISAVIDNPLPGILASDIIPFKYTFYDNYSWNGAKAFIPAYRTQLNKGNNLTEDPRPNTPFTRGKVTGEKVRVIGSEKWLTSTAYYDDKGRLLQEIQDNNLGGTDVNTHLYDFDNTIICTYYVHKNPSSTTTPEIKLREISEMDHAGRLLRTKIKLNDAAAEKILLENSYFESGELKTKILGNVAQQDYDYYLNGKLKSINKDYVNNTNTAGFGQELYYDYGFTSPDFTGEIAGIVWRGDGPARAYGYKFDPAGRLQKADFLQKDGNAWLQGNVNFSVYGPAASGGYISYDANGNIQSMNQKGLKGTTSDDIDILQYQYYSNSNRLRSVTDGKNDANSLLGDFKEKTSGQATDYTYDLNGNLLQDNNKGITQVTYNELDLPEKVIVAGKGTITFKYAADGTKLQKIVEDNSGSTPVVKKYDYNGGLLYENGILKFITHDEGRIRVIQKTGQPVAYYYDYFLKDHLGDVRLVYTEQTDPSTYFAGLEPANAAKENLLFSNVDATRMVKPSGYPQADSANRYAARLNAKFEDKKIGPSIVLKVMAGDTVSMKVNAFHKSHSATNRKVTEPVQDMLAPLLLAFGGGGKEGGSKQMVESPSGPFNADFTNDKYQRLKNRDQQGAPNRGPKAYLNYVLFDEQFNLIEESSGVKQVQSTPDVLQDLAKGGLPIVRNGYLYVYTSNESTEDVYFDDLSVLLAPGLLLEETHYYPFGLTMEGISSKAVLPATYPENKYRFNGKELQTDEFGNGTGLDWYDYGARMYEPQIGRWHAIDGASKDYYNNSPYHYSGNNPIMNKDVDGNRYFPIAWSSMNINVQRIVDAGASKQMMYDKWVRETPEGREYDMNKKYAHRLRKDMMGPTFPYGTGAGYGRGGGGGFAGGSGRTGSVLRKMMNFGVSMIPVMGSVVRGLNAVQRGDYRGAAKSAMFAIVEGASFAGGLRTVSAARGGGSAAFKGGGRASGAGIMYNSGKGTGFVQPPTAAGVKIGNGYNSYVSPMKIVGTSEIPRGAKISDLVTNAINRTYTQQVEHAIVKLGPNSVAPGARVLVSGGRDGISFKPGEVSIIYGHTHPYATGPSVGDYQALKILGQSKQYIFEGFSTKPIVIRQTK